MELKSLLVDSKTAWVEFPGLEDFEVELANLSRKELINLRKRCTTNKFDRKTRMFNEELDESKFVVELGKNKDDLLPYSEENAKLLVENSQEFDNWLNEVVFDLDNFRSKEPEKSPKTARPVSQE